MVKAPAIPSGKALVTTKKMPAYDEPAKVDVNGHRHFLQMMAHLLQAKEAGKTDGGKMAFRTMSEGRAHTSEHSDGAKKKHLVREGQGDAIEALALLQAHRQPGDFVLKASEGSKHDLAGKLALGEAQGGAAIDSRRHKGDGQVLAQNLKHPYAPGFAPDRIDDRLSKPTPVHMAMNAPLTGVPSRGRDAVPAEAKPVRLNGEPIAANAKASTEKTFAASGRTIPAIADAIKSDESNRGSDFNRFGKPHNGEAAAWFSSGPMSKIQQLVLHGQSAPTRAVDIVEQVKAAVTKGNFKTLADGSMQLSIKLHPAHLGELQIVLVKNETGLDVTLIAHTEAAKKLLESQLGDLKQSFQTLGMNVHKIDIQQPNAAQAQSSGFSGYPDGHSGGGHGREQGDKKPPTGREDQGDHDVGHAFDDWLTEGGSSS